MPQLKKKQSAQQQTITDQQKIKGEKIAAIGVSLVPVDRSLNDMSSIKHCKSESKKPPLPIYIMYIYFF